MKPNNENKPNNTIRIWNHLHVMTDLDPIMYRDNQPPYVSIYLPIVHNDRAGGQSDYDRIEFKDLKKQAELDLARDFQPDQWRGIHDRLDFLEKHADPGVWQQAWKGGSHSIGYLVSNTEIFVYKLDQPVKPISIVGQKFYLKPLFDNYENTMNYYILALSNDRYAVIKGDEDGLMRLPYPENVDGVMSTEGQTDEFQFDTYDRNPGMEGEEGQVKESGSLDFITLEGHLNPYHGWKSRNDVRQDEGEKWFRYVNQVVNDSIKKHDPTPVILCTLPEHVSEWQKACTIHDMMPEVIKKNPDQLDARTLLQDAVAIMRDFQAKKQQEYVEQFEYDASKGKGSTDAEEVGKAIFDDRVATLLVKKGKHLAGTYDKATGAVKQDLAKDLLDDMRLDPASPDLIDALAQAALDHGGRVIILEAEQMPKGADVAAIYRY